MYRTFLGMSLIFTAMTMSKGTPPPRPPPSAAFLASPVLLGGLQCSCLLSVPSLLPKRSSGGLRMGMREGGADRPPPSACSQQSNRPPPTPVRGWSRGVGEC